MAILRGDWVLVDGEVGQVVVDDFHKDGSGWCIVYREGYLLNTLRPPFELTKIDPAFHKLLTDVYKE
jgi:hypothetical protein